MIWAGSFPTGTLLIKNRNIMNIIEQINRKYQTSIEKPWGTIMVPHNVSLDYINDCIRNNVAITGIDRFRVKNGTEPLEIADFSDYCEKDWKVYVAELAKSAKQFINGFEDEEDIYYEFVLIEKSEFPI
jgi:phosphopantetheine adenylyltransferase